jgi:hypothetical protein
MGNQVLTSAEKLRSFSISDFEYFIQKHRN